MIRRNSLPMTPRRRPSALLVSGLAVATLANLCLCPIPRVMSGISTEIIPRNTRNASGPRAISDVPAEIIPKNATNNDQLPLVACFFMVARRSVEAAVAVRYSSWARRCSEFVIVANGIGGERHLDDNTVLVDIHHAMRLELEVRGAISRDGDASSGNSTAPSHATFPSPEDEVKTHLSLKSFYSWMYMTRRYSDRVDYIMKADPDTYMLMDNYLRYLSDYYAPGRHAYIGRVFVGSPNHLEPYVTGASCTLSRTTARLLLSKSSIEMIRGDNNIYDHPPQCSAEAFEQGGKADDYILAACLSSAGVYPAYTRDGAGLELFSHLRPTEPALGNGELPVWYREWPHSKCCSSEACAFHYVPAESQNDTLVWDEVLEVWHWKKAEERVKAPPKIAGPTPCADDPGWHRRDTPNRKCGYVAQLPENRCKVLGEDGRLASEACPEACGWCGP